MPKKPIITMSSNPASNSGKAIIIEKLNILLQPLKDRHARHYRDSYFHFWADLLLAGMLIGSAIILVWLIFWQPQPDFVLEARLPVSRVLSGQTEEFIIHYQNKEDYTIGAASLTLNLPAHFVFESASPAASYDIHSSEFLLGDLKKGAQGELRIKGVIRGEAGEQQMMTFNLTYQYGQIRKQLLNSLSYTIDGSVLEMTLNLPDKVFTGIPFNGSIQVKNAGRSKIDNAALTMTNPGWELTPENFSFEDNYLKLPSLEPGETKQINFSAFTDLASGSADFSMESDLLLDKLSLKQSDISHPLTVTDPSLSVSASYKNASLSTKDANLEISFKNNEKSEITNLLFSFESKRDNVVVKNISSPTLGVSSTNNSLAYNSTIPADGKGGLEATINLERQSVVFNDAVAISINVSYTINNQNYSYSIAAPALKINSNLTVSSAGYYYGPQGDQLGVGPLPPKVDIPTTYWVIWEANNLGNDISNFEVSADLPSNIVWVDQKSIVAGDLSYSPIGRRILWRVDSISHQGGNYRVSFALSLVPRSGDIGTIPTLLSNISFTAKDQFTGALITNKLANITTNIESDRLSAGKGKVEPQ